MGLMRPLLTPLIAQVAPTLDLDLTAEYLDPRITFTRSTTRTRFGADRLRKIAAVNEWPLEYDPTTGECLGRAVWEARTNLIRQSNSLGTSPWVNPSITVTAGTDTGADGTTSLATVAVTGGGGRLTQPITISSGATVCVQAVAKLKNCDFLRLDVGADNSASGNRFSAWFNLATGQVASTSASTWSALRAGIQALPNGLFLCWVAGVTSGVTTAHVVARPAQSDGGSAVPGDQVGLGDFQAEAAPFPSPYIPTTTATVARAADVPLITSAASFGYNGAASTWCGDAIIYGEKNNSSSSYLAGMGVTADNNTFRCVCLSIDNRLNIGLQNPAANIPEFYDVTGQRLRVASSFTQFAADKAAVNGVTRTATTNGGAGTLNYSQLDRLGIGHAGRASSVSESLNGVIRRLRYWPTLLTQEELNGLTG